MKAKFLAGNILDNDSTSAGSWLTDFDSTIHVIFAYWFLHLFSWEKYI